MKDQAILCSHMGELGWEILRFFPHVIWNKTVKYKNEVKLIAHTRPDRFDLYGTYADEFEPLDIPNNFTADCFKIKEIDEINYKKIVDDVYKKYQDKYDIKTHIFPNISKDNFSKKDQFNHNQMVYNFKPRKENAIEITNRIPSDKPIIGLAPRYRKNLFRNWSHWIELYDLIYKDEYLRNNFIFIIFGKSNEYIPDPEKRFFDINDIPLTENTSLIGLTIEAIKKSILFCGSQSGLPTLSNLIGTQTLQFGHEQWQHEKTYNVKNTKTTFIKTKSSKTYDELSANIVFEKLKKLLKKRKT